MGDELGWRGLWDASLRTEFRAFLLTIFKGFFSLISSLGLVGIDFLMIAIVIRLRQNLSKIVIGITFVAKDVRYNK